MKKLFLSLATLPATSFSMQMHRPWTTKHWCQSVIRPEWPFAYSKYANQTEETKGRVSTNQQDVRHECETRGVQSKCHVCEDFVCGIAMDQICHFQLQGVKWNEMSVNIPTVSDVPWAVNGKHRYDFGGSSTTHVCMYLSAKSPCQSSFGDDYSACELRCWGYGMTGENATVTSVTRMEGDADGKWPNHRVDSLQGVNSTPWEEPSPKIAWEYPKFGATSEVPKNPIPREDYALNPQGFVFTLAGSNNGEEGFVDGLESDARFRYPEGVAVDHDGYVYVADTGNHAIRVISPGGRVVTLAGTGTPGYKDGLASDGAQFSSPADVAVWRDWSWWPYENPIDPDSLLYRNGNGTLVLFVADTDNHRIRKISGDVSYGESGEKTWTNVFVECFSGRCGILSTNPEPGLADGDKGIARFDSPQGIAVSHDGKVFVADTNNHLVREIDRFGVVKTIAGSTTVAETNRNGRKFEGCREPCLTGDPGTSDGLSTDSHFIYPVDVALDPEASAVFVTDQHHIRKLDLIDRTVTTLAGGDIEGDRDGIGSESTFNNPASIAVTGDGVIYVADLTTCRIRRISNPSDFIPHVSCQDDLPSLTKPHSCSSYNIPSDEHGMTASPLEGYIHYNYLYRYVYDDKLGLDYIGRTLKDCVGSPPSSLLDVKSWNETIQDYPFNFNLVVDGLKTQVREDPNDGTRITVVCSSSCSDDFAQHDMIEVSMPGIEVNHFYSEAVSVCGAARKEGILTEGGSRIVDITIVSNDILNQSSGSLLESRQHFFASTSSGEMRVQTIAGAPARLRGIAAFVNSSIDNTSRFMFIADRDNHAVRAMSAICTFICENGGQCISPDKCKCIEGWSGVDCTKPLCRNSCSSREICVAPNTCACIPGYGGEACLDATCAQDCKNGGYCSAPDTCTCSPGWFDSNCTTPVCRQTCGNGGNCTGPDICTCPSDWGGVDCRVPVCEQTCHNGGVCVAPKTCLCPPNFQGFDCSMPVCHQGFFVPYDELPEAIKSVATRKDWIEYRPCNYSAWCNATNGFDCSQRGQTYNTAIPLYGEEWRLPWNAFDSPQSEITQPYTFSIDRQVALVAYVNVTQGLYMCANDGVCVHPDVCSCRKGWIGFDCRVPVCEQGYYEQELESFVKGVQSDGDFATFERFLDPRRPYNLDSSRNFSSNPNFEVWVEQFTNASSLARNLVLVNGSRYFDSGINKNLQGGYECSIRSVTRWENAEFVFDHPNYYSRYMDEKVEDDGSIYSDWNGMHYPPTHRKTARLIKHHYEYVSSNSTVNRAFVYTDVGHLLDGVWKVTGAKWTKGNCVVEFERRCEGALEQIKALVQDTDESYRPRISYDDNRSYIEGLISKEEVCVDRVVRGCFNNGTCIAPNKCECSPGWTGKDCNIPICENTCLHNGNCTHPNTCTCERGWSGDDCSIALCAQVCKNGGYCIAPDTCRCHQWMNTWRDESTAGVPLFKKPNGNPQMTGWTGYDCSTPICVQAERFRLNVDSKLAPLSDIVPLGGHKNRETECNEVRCPEFDEMLTQNDGKSFQSGCGWDVLETGCCFLSESGSFTCFRCLDLEIKDSNATCSHEFLKKWQFESIAMVPLSFRERGEIRMCGPDISPKISGGDIEDKSSVTVTSNLFLCNRIQWEQGDYIDDAGMGDVDGLGADFGLKEGRHTRVNFNNYVRSREDENIWITGPEIAGEGIFECYNYGSCIEPDTCSCKDGYGGFDCSTPLCRHQQDSGNTVGCQNGGVCVEKDDCHCIQRESLLWKVHSNVDRGLTGWTGTDCSMPMCIQGFYDPACNATEYAPGREGCYRCANGGLCISPDTCLCADGWTGYDCRKPICKAEATALIRSQLMTTDPVKIQIFENDPCGMRGFSSLRDDSPRGVCVMPNKCTCMCKGSHDDNLCRKLGGKFCQTAFHDPLFRRRNILAPNEVFGTRDCYSGYEGIVDENDMFGSCHLTIYEPSVFHRYTVVLVTTTFIGLICICAVLGCIWIKLTSLRTLRRKHRQQVRSKKDTGMTHSLGYGFRKKKE
eukprot:CCRYP_007413-RA/>CCRYP_007413-RA protein AED:0.05 eAED:0.03 QI:0/0/0/1/1/1/4/0/2016